MGAGQDPCCGGKLGSFPQWEISTWDPSHDPFSCWVPGTLPTVGSRDLCWGGKLGSFPWEQDGILPMIVTSDPSCSGNLGFFLQLQPGICPRIVSHGGNLGSFHGGELGSFPWWKFGILPVVGSWDIPGGAAPWMEPKGRILRLDPEGRTWSLPGSALWTIPGLTGFAWSTGNDTKSHWFFLEIPIPTQSELLKFPAFPVRVCPVRVLRSLLRSMCCHS